MDELYNFNLFKKNSIKLFQIIYSKSITRFFFLKLGYILKKTILCSWNRNIGAIFSYILIF